MAYADVAVNAPGAGRRSYSYSVPEEFEGRLRPGHAVLAPFGSRSYQGIVISITAEPGFPRVRPIQAILEDEPVIAEPLIDLGRWIAERYQSSLYAGYQPMLPPAFERRQSTIVRATEEGRAALDQLTERQSEVMELVLEAGETTTNAIRNQLGARAARDVTALNNRGYVETTDVMEGARISARFEIIVQLMTPAADALAKAANYGSQDHFGRRTLWRRSLSCQDPASRTCVASRGRSAAYGMRWRSPASFQWRSGRHGETLLPRMSRRPRLQLAI